MTIPSGQPYKTSHVGNGVASTFDYDFKITSESDLLVTTTDTAGVATVLTLGVDYTVTGVGINAGGSITLTAGSLATGYDIVIEDNVQPSQETPFRNQSSFFGINHENAFDKLTRLVRRALERLSNVLYFPSNVSGFDPSLPEPRALTYMRINSTNDGIELVDENTVVADAASGFKVIKRTLTAGQSVISIAPETYTPGINSVFVIANGSFHAPDFEEFAETDSSTITLANAVTGDTTVYVLIGVAKSGGIDLASNVSYTPSGTGAVATDVQTKLRERISVRDFGAVGDGVTDDTAAIQAAIATGKNVFGVSGETYLISGRIVPQANQTIDLRGAKLLMAPGTSFTATDSMVELENNGSSIINFEIDGNKSNVTHVAGAGSDLAGVVVRAKNCKVKNGYIHDCKTNGYLNYGSDASGNTFTDCRTEDNDYTGFGNEIPTQGDTVASNLVFHNIRSSGNTLGGLYLASGINTMVSDVVCNDGNRSYFYIGDADGGLFNCKVVNSKFATTNTGTPAVTVEGEVQTGALSGNKNTCQVDFVNTEINSGGSGDGLEVNGDAVVRFSTLSVADSGIGVEVNDNSELSGIGLRIRNTTNHGILTANKINVTDVDIESYGSGVGSQAGIYLNTGADGSIIDGLKVGAASGETGEHGVWGVAGLTGIEIKRFKTFTGSGTKLNFTAADMATWSIDEADSDSDLFQSGTWNGKALFIGSGFIWIDSTGDVRVKSGTTKPTNDTDGTVVGTQT